MTHWRQYNKKLQAFNKTRLSTNTEKYNNSYGVVTSISLVVNGAQLWWFGYRQGISRCTRIKYICTFAMLMCVRNILYCIVALFSACAST